MLKLKSQLTCSYCSKIFKDPIVLPCDDSICLQHLSERGVLKQNKIKCNKCKQEFQVKANQFKSNEALSQIIESQSHLIDEEISLKQQLEVSIKKFFEYYDEFIQNKTQLESDVFDNFQEMRFKVWVLLINIHNMHLKQMKQYHFWLGHLIFNWTKLKFMKKNKK
jgi:hypothetical protein